MKLALLIALASIASSTTAQTNPACDCLAWPYKPPECARSCYAQLTAKPNPDLSGIKDLDPGVALSLKVLAARSDRTTIDFSKIQTTKDLEALALKSVQQKQVIVVAPKAVAPR